jgi:hypothetical protein
MIPFILKEKGDKGTIFFDIMNKNRKNNLIQLIINIL